MTLKKILIGVGFLIVIGVLTLSIIGRKRRKLLAANGEEAAL